MSEPGLNQIEQIEQIEKNIKRIKTKKMKLIKHKYKKSNFVLLFDELDYPPIERDKV